MARTLTDNPCVSGCVRLSCCSVSPPNLGFSSPYKSGEPHVVFIALGPDSLPSS